MSFDFKKLIEDAANDEDLQKKDAMERIKDFVERCKADADTEAGKASLITSAIMSLALTAEMDAAASLLSKGGPMEMFGSALEPREKVLVMLASHLLAAYGHRALLMRMAGDDPEGFKEAVRDTFDVALKLAQHMAPEFADVRADNYGRNKPHGGKPN